MAKTTDARRAANNLLNPTKRASDEKSCIECNGRGKLWTLPGDWGKTVEVEVTCWRCKGTGLR